MGGGRLPSLESWKGIALVRFTRVGCDGGANLRGICADAQSAESIALSARAEAALQSVLMSMLDCTIEL